MCWTGLSGSGALEQLEQLISLFYWLGNFWQRTYAECAKSAASLCDFWSSCLPLFALFSFINSPGQQTRTCSESSLLRRGCLTFLLYLAPPVSAYKTTELVKAILMSCFYVEVIPQQQWSPLRTTLHESASDRPSNVRLSFFSIANPQITCGSIADLVYRDTFSMNNRGLEF